MELARFWHILRDHQPLRGRTMTREELLKRVSELESLNDQLVAEIRYLDNLLREVGFEDGLKTLKFAAKELIEEDRKDQTG